MLQDNSILYYLLRRPLRIQIVGMRVRVQVSVGIEQVNPLSPRDTSFAFISTLIKIHCIPCSLSNARERVLTRLVLLNCFVLKIQRDVAPVPRLNVSPISGKAFLILAVPLRRSVGINITPYS